MTSSSALRLFLLSIAVPLSACGPVDATSDAHESSVDALRVGAVVVPPIDGRIPPGLLPAVAIDDVVAIQPGWVRVTLTWQRAVGTDLAFDVEPTCAPYPGDGPVIRTTALVDDKTHRAVVDMKIDRGALAANALRQPCNVTSLTAVMRRGATTIAQSTAARSFAMDVPLSHLTPYRFTAPIAADSVQLDPRPFDRRWAAYPPQIIAVKSVLGRVAFLEVEELSPRGTLALRGLAGFDGSSTTSWRLAFELHGGGEVPHGWGIDVDSRGISRADVPVESSHPGANVFPGGTWNPSFVTDPTKLVLPAPPLTTEATYLAMVLDNHGILRAPRPKDALDVEYDAATHTLRAVNAAKVALVEGPPIDRVAFGRISGATIMPRQGATLDALAVTSTDFAPVTTTFQGPGAPAKLTARSWSPPPLAPALDASVGELAPSGPLPQRPPSPEELAAMSDRPGLPAPLVGTCINTEPPAGLTIPDRCLGYKANGCPTKADPLRPETLPRSPGTATDVSVDDILTPQAAGRMNIYGTCGTHSQVQHYEAVYNKLLDDLGPRRVVDVDGLPVTIPEPRVALSPAAFLSNLQTSLGTTPDSSDPGEPVSGLAPREAAQLPQFAEAYWPARESTLVDWSTTNPSMWLSRCRTTFWMAGFCSGQGTQPVGVYRSYSTMVATAGADPLREGLWSLVNSYMAIKTATLDLSDRDAAIDAVIAELRTGLPVRLSFLSVFKAKPGTKWPLPFLEDDMTFWLPPNLAGCDLEQLYVMEGGHFVNIVGAHVVPAADGTPDPFRSLFIVQNNWGPQTGYRGFHMMTFAAFRATATGLMTYRLARECGSVACGGL